MCRVAGFCLSWLSTVQPSMSGRNTSSDTAVGWYSRASASASAPRIATSTFKPVIVRQIDQDARVMRIVLDDQQHRVARLDATPVVRHRLDRTLGQPHAAMAALRLGSGAARLLARAALRAAGPT